MQFSGQAKHDKQLYIVLIKATRVSTVFHLTSNSNDFYIFALVDSSLPEFLLRTNIMTSSQLYRRLGRRTMRVETKKYKIKSKGEERQPT